MRAPDSPIAMKTVSPPPFGPGQSHDHDRIRVVERAGQLAVVAASPMLAGTEILYFDGQVVPHASRYSVQVGIDEHIELLGESGDCDRSRRHAWRYLNHSCDPSAAPRGRVLVALRDLAPGDQITFDYEANEWQMAEPFLCGCGAAGCRGWIRGYGLLTREQRARLAVAVSPHLLALDRPIEPMDPVR